MKDQDKPMTAFETKIMLAVAFMVGFITASFLNWLDFLWEGPWR